MNTSVDSASLSADGPPPRLALDPDWAWSPYQPSPARPWNIALAAHLLRRAGFGPNHPELQTALTQGPQPTLDRLLAAADQPADGDDSDTAALAAAAHSGNPENYLAWWLRRLLETPAVLREKMTLLWHNHFAIAAAASPDLTSFHRHLQSLRSAALGDFGVLLRTQLEDPAMFSALGGAANRRAQPNTTFAQPWLSRFTVGPNTATDSDVRETARALTGWFVYGGRMRWIEREHDDGPKEILGTSGHLGRDDLAPLLSAHPATARSLASRLVRWFVTETASPSPELLEPLAKQLHGPKGVRRALETLLRSNLFFSDYAVGQKTKSPVELLVGLGRAFQVVLPTTPMARDVARMGQALTAPPTVSGWAGGVHWINSISLVTRQRCCRAVLTGAEGYGKGLDPTKIAGTYGCASPDAVAQLWQHILLPSSTGQPDASAPTFPASNSEVLGFVESLLLRPEFQLC